MEAKTRSSLRKESTKNVSNINKKAIFTGLENTLNLEDVNTEEVTEVVSPEEYNRTEYFLKAKKIPKEIPPKEVSPAPTTKLKKRGKLRYKSNKVDVNFEKYEVILKSPFPLVDKKFMNNFNYNLLMISPKEEYIKKKVEERKKLTTFMHEDPYAYLIKIVKKTKRNEVENIIIANFLKTMNVFMSLIRNSADLAEQIASKIKYQKVPKNVTFFKIGDYGEIFYVILKGKVSVFVERQIKSSLTNDEYFLHLLKLRKYSENYLLNRTIDVNKHIIEIPKGDEFIPFFEGYLINLKNKFELMTREQEEIYRSIDALIHCTPHENCFEDGFKYQEMSMPKVIQRKLINLTKENIYIKRRDFIIPTYLKSSTLTVGDYFGEKALIGKNPKRTAVIYTEDDCDLGYLDKEGYEFCVKDQHVLMIKQNVNILMANPLFNYCTKSYFEKNIFPMFTYYNSIYGTTIIKENERHEDIYFIKSGEYYVTMNKSILEINELILCLGGSISKKELEDERERLATEKIFKTYMEKKRFYNIAIVESKDILGLEDFVQNKKFSFSVQVKSSSGEYWKMEKHVFNSFKTINDVFTATEAFTKEKKSYLISRIKDLKAQVMSLYDDYRFETFKRAIDQKNQRSINAVDSFRSSILSKQIIITKKIDKVENVTSRTSKQWFKLSKFNKTGGIEKLDKAVNPHNKAKFGKSLSLFSMKSDRNKEKDKNKDIKPDNEIEAESSNILHTSPDNRWLRTAGGSMFAMRNTTSPIFKQDNHEIKETIGKGERVNDIVDKNEDNRGEERVETDSIVLTSPLRGGIFRNKSKVIQNMKTLTFNSSVEKFWDSSKERGSDFSTTKYNNIDLNPAGTLKQNVKSKIYSLKVSNIKDLTNKLKTETIQHPKAGKSKASSSGKHLSLVNPQSSNNFKTKNSGVNLINKINKTIKTNIYESLQTFNPSSSLNKDLIIDTIEKNQELVSTNINNSETARQERLMSILSSINLNENENESNSSESSKTGAIKLSKNRVILESKVKKENNNQDSSKNIPRIMTRKNNKSNKFSRRVSDLNMLSSFQSFRLNGVNDETEAEKAKEECEVAIIQEPNKGESSTKLERLAGNTLAFTQKTNANYNANVTKSIEALSTFVKEGTTRNTQNKNLSTNVNPNVSNAACSIGFDSTKIRHYNKSYNDLKSFLNTSANTFTVRIHNQSLNKLMGISLK